MPELVDPSDRLHQAWLAAREDWGPGRHEDGFGLMPSDEVDSAEGFGAWITRLAQESEPTDPADADYRCRYWWIVENDQVQGGIALRWGEQDFIRMAGHIGYGIRPSARHRGLATWALAQVLDIARAVGLDRVLLVCEEGNAASATTIERNGGVLEATLQTDEGVVRRYWISLRASAKSLQRR